MYRYINQIKKIAKAKKIPLKFLAEQINMTEAGFHQSIKKKTLRFDNFLKICKILEVDPAEILKEGESNEVSEGMASYKLSEEEMIKEIYKSVKRIERQLNSGNSGRLVE